MINFFTKTFISTPSPPPPLTVLLGVRQWSWLDVLVVRPGQEVLVPRPALLLVVLLVSAPDSVHLAHTDLHHR